MQIRTTLKVLNKDLWVYEIDASDNPYMLIYSGNEGEVIQVSNLLETRLSEHFNNKKDFVTSDIEGMQYIKKKIN